MNTSHKIINHSRQTYGAYIILFFILISLFAQSSLLIILGGLTLSAIILYLWKPYSPPTLLYFYFFHWLQVFAAIIYAGSAGYQPDEMFYTHETDKLIGITFVQIILMVMISKVKGFDKYKRTYQDLKTAADKINFRRLLIAYIVSLIVFPSLNAFTVGNASLNQLVLAFGVLRVVIIILLIFLLFLSNTVNKKIIIIILIIEFLLSFVSYFSSFKDLLVYIILVYLTVHPKIKVRSIVRLVPILFFGFMVISFWSTVKGDYRFYLNQASNQQTISVEKGEALSYLSEKVKDIDLEMLSQGQAQVLKRLQYMEQYSKVYERVPVIIPYQNGENLKSTILFLTTPRFLNQDKAVLDPSTKTAYYTGKNYANAEQGTSISMGYFSDLYIDFGILGMTFGLIIIAFLIAIIHRYILSRKKYNLLFNYALVMGIIFSLGAFESDITFFLGMIRNYVVMFIICDKYVFPAVNRYLIS